MKRDGEECEGELEENNKRERKLNMKESNGGRGWWGLREKRAVS